MTAYDGYDYKLLECRGGPLDGEMVPNVGPCKRVESEVFVNCHPPKACHYHRCPNGHYHYEGYLE